MKIANATLVAYAFLRLYAGAATPDPVEQFKSETAIPVGDKIVKWECEVADDWGKAVFLSLKSDFAISIKDHEPAGWTVYLKFVKDGGFSISKGTEEETGAISVGDVPEIDIETCYIGNISELRQKGIVTMRVDNPREGPPIATIYAYLIKGDHLVRKTLAKFDAREANSVFDKYLSDSRRTHIRVQEISPRK